MISDRVPSSDSRAVQIANKLDATRYTLHAPGLISSADLARTVRESLQFGVNWVNWVNWVGWWGGM
ncbi:MAG: hypothetical protein AAGA87_02990 [Pseudomonadota bacterium]